MIGAKDIKLPSNCPKELILHKHEKYLKKYANDDTDIDQIFAEYLKMSGMYWGLNALYIMKALDEHSPEVPRALIFIKTNQTKEGGFAASHEHDPHILHTLSAVQMLVILNKLDSNHIDIERCVNYIKSLQQKDGSFFGDKWGEVDTRFSFCALATMKLLGKLDEIDVDKAVEFVLSCNNQIDGGFGSKPGSESHSAYVYCCVGSLAITGNLDKIDTEQLGWWLSERQLPSGGLNGRPEKLPDVCYSWWCLSSLQMIDKMHLIDHKKLMIYILACQDKEKGGFSDRPGNMVDPYHTMFGVASISLICRYFNRLQMSGDEEHEFLKKVSDYSEKLKLVNPVLCMPEDRLDKIK